MTVSILASLLVALTPLAAAQPPAPEDVAAVTSEVRDARRGVTAGSWRASHPSDSAEPFSLAKPGHDTEQWCVRFIRTATLPSGAPWKRTAYFFHPPPPIDLRLPSGGVDEATRDCVLGLVWIEAPADSRGVLSRAMAAVLGEGTSVRDPWIPSGWSDAEGWSRPGGLRGMVARDGDRALAHLSLPEWDRWWLGDPSGPEDPSAERAERAALLDRVRLLAASVRASSAVDRQARAKMVALLEDHDYWTLDNLPTSEVVAAFEPWLASARTLGPARRVDALLLADRVMELVGDRVIPEDEAPAAEGRVRLAGAEFAYAPLGGGWVYAHSFARDALQAAPSGPPTTAQCSARWSSGSTTPGCATRATTSGRGSSPRASRSSRAARTCVSSRQPT